MQKYDDFRQYAVDHDWHEFAYQVFRHYNPATNMVYIINTEIMSFSAHYPHESSSLIFKEGLSKTDLKTLLKVFGRKLD